jgi:rSAM/selenodomain-associated transferase 2
MSHGGGISVVIPTWCERAQIGEAVRAGWRVADEVVVADAGSPDGTAEAATDAGARVVRAERGRGSQLDGGARAATGEVLLFLHADARIGPSAGQRIREVLRDPDVRGGNFYLRFVPATGWGELFTRANDVRRRWMGIYYGDSGIFVRKGDYLEMGGFKPLPIMEDYEFARRLERRGRTVYVRDVTVEVSGRRFMGRPVRTLLVWALVQGLYTLGVGPRRLAALYADIR